MPATPEPAAPVAPAVIHRLAPRRPGAAVCDDDRPVRAVTVQSDEIFEAGGLMERELRAPNNFCDKPPLDASS